MDNATNKPSYCASPHRHVFRFHEEKQKFVIYKCIRCPETRIDPKGNLVITSGGKLRVLVPR